MTISNYFIIFGIVSAVTSWWLNSMINRYYKNSLSICLICIALYIVTMAFLIFANNKFLFVIPFVGIGIFGVLAWVHLNNIFSQAVDEKEQGLIFGISQATWSLGGLIGTFLVGLTSAVHEKVTAATPVFFEVLALITMILMLMTLRRKKNVILARHTDQKEVRAK